MENLCVIFGGASTEHDISIITGMQLAKNLQTKYKVEKIYLGLDNKFYYATKVNDLSYFNNKAEIKLKEIYFNNNTVFLCGPLRRKLFNVNTIINCCHGGIGENGDLSGFFETQNIKLTSANSLSAHIAMDKSLTKQLLKDLVPTIPGVKITEQNYNNYKDLTKDLTFDLIVKPNSLGSSIGVEAKTQENFIEQVDAIFALNDSALVENRIVNLKEYNQACFRDGNKLILSEIENPISTKDFLTFDEKYNHNEKQKGKDRIIPAEISKELKTEIETYTKLIYEKLNMNGIVRIDYIFDADTNKLYFNEINTIPGSMAFYLYEPMGIDYITLIEKLVKNAGEVKNYSYFDTGVLAKKLL